MEMTSMRTSASLGDMEFCFCDYPQVVTLFLSTTGGNGVMQKASDKVIAPPRVEPSRFAAGVGRDRRTTTLLTGAATRGDVVPFHLFQSKARSQRVRTVASFLERKNSDECVWSMDMRGASVLIAALSHRMEGSLCSIELLIPPCSSRAQRLGQIRVPSLR
jgi:hypothetical protein